MFEVSVKTLDGASRTFNIEDEDMTVLAFREMIVREMDIPMDRQRLIFQGKVLVDERKLKDCGVDSKTIHLVPRPPPQVNHESPSSSSTPENPRQRSANPLFGASNMDVQNLLDINNNPPIIAAINEQFNQFLNDARQILDEMERGEVPTQSGSTGGVSAAAAPAGTPSAAATTASAQIVNFGRLADVLCEYRQIEARMQPFVVRYQNMLRAEQARRNASRAVASTAPSTSEPMDTSDKPVDEPWSDDFFEQMSRLFHVNAHLLHLLSEFFVATNQTRGSSRGSSIRRSVTTRSMSAQRPPQQQQPAAPTRAGASAAASPVRRTPRALVIAHPNTSVVYAHINIEPYVFSVSRTPTQQQESATTNDATTTTTAAAEETPTVVDGSADDEAANTRRRSHSANPPGLGSFLPDILGVGMYNMDLGDALFSGGERSAASSTESSATPTAATTTTTSAASTSTTAGENAAAAAAEQSRSDSATRSAAPATAQVRSTASSGSTQARLPIPFNDLLVDLQRSRDRFLPCSSRHMNPRPQGHNLPGGVFVEEGGPEGVRRPGYIVRLPRARRAITPGAEARRVSTTAATTTAVPTSGPGVPGPTPPSANPLAPITGTISQGVSPPPQLLLELASVTRYLHRLVESGGSTGTTASATPTSSSSGGGEGGATTTGTTTTAAAASTVTSAAMDTFTRLLGGVTQHITQLAASGVVPSMNVAASTSGPFTLVVEEPSRDFLNTRSGQPRTGLANGTSLAGAPREPSRMNMLPGMVVDSLLRSMWSFIFDLALLELPSSGFPSSRATDWAQGVPTTTTTTTETNTNTTSECSTPYQPRISLDPFNSVMTALANRLSEVASAYNEGSGNGATQSSTTTTTTTTPPTPLLLHALNRVYDSAETLAREQLVSSSDSGVELAPRLMALLLNTWDTDDAVRHPAPEAEALSWAMTLACEHGEAPAMDLRRSLYNFIRDSLARHMVQWSSPTPEQQEAPGRMLLTSMRAWMLDALVFCHVLQHRAATRLGLRPNDGEDLVSTGPLSHLLVDLERFTVTLPAGSNARVGYDLVRQGLSTLSSDLHREGPRLLAENRQRYTAYLATRDSFIDLSTEPQQQPQSQTSTSERLEEVTPILPEMQDGFQAPASTAEALAPHPEAPQREDRAPSLPSHPPGDFPAAWADVVAEDVAQMASQTSVASMVTGSTGGVNESGGLRRRIETGEEADATDEQAVSRLSDAYIAGMPVKRRRVMLERKQSLACPMDELFMNLLNEAMSQPASPAASASSSSTASPAETNSTTLPPPPPPRSVAEAFRAHVRDHLARRLASDPDFDAHRHPAASEVFAKRRGGGK